MVPFSETNLIPAIPSIVYAKATNHIRPGLYHSKRNHLRYIFYILILRSSDTQLNPGPSPSEVTQHVDDFPCGVCADPCDWGQDCIRCDDCSTWFHKNCIKMNDEVFLPFTRSNNSMLFTCFSCGVPVFSTSLFDSVPFNTVQSSNATSFDSIVKSDISTPDSISSFNISDVSGISGSTASSTSDQTFHPSCSSPKPRTKQRLRTNNIRLASLNIQSIASPKKKACFWNFLESINYDILCGCETWLKPEILDAELLPPNSNYNIHRKDRHDGYGGSIILIKDNIQHERIEINTPCDIVFVKIDCANKESLIVGSVYRPTNNNESYSQVLFGAISKISKQFRKSAIWITGDFNLPDINWSDNIIQGHQYKKSINEMFLQMEPDLSLTQMIDFHTRCTNILDLFFTNRPDLVNQCSPMPGISDHHAVFVDTNMCAPRIKQPKRTLYMWGKANIENIKKKCSSLSDVIIEAVSTTVNIDEVWSLFKNGCQLIINEEVPSRQSSQRYNQPWANRDVRRMTRQKRRWFKRARRTNSQHDWKQYKDIKRRAQ